MNKGDKKKAFATANERTPHFEKVNKVKEIKRKSPWKHFLFPIFFPLVFFFTFSTGPLLLQSVTATTSLFSFPSFLAPFVPAPPSPPSKLTLSQTTTLHTTISFVQSLRTRHAISFPLPFYTPMINFPTTILNLTLTTNHC